MSFHKNMPEKCLVFQMFMCVDRIHSCCLKKNNTITSLVPQAPLGIHDRARSFYSNFVFIIRDNHMFAREYISF